MSFPWRETTRNYILLKHIKLYSEEMQCEHFRRGQILEKLDGPYSYRPNGFIALFSRNGQRFLFPIGEVATLATLTEEEVENLMKIDSLETRYQAFKEAAASHFDMPPEPGSKVFVKVNGIEYPGVVMAVLPSYSTPMIKVVIQRHNIPWSYAFSLNDNLVVKVSLDDLRPRKEKDKMQRSTDPSWQWAFATQFRNNGFSTMGSYFSMINSPVDVSEENESFDKFLPSFPKFKEMNYGSTIKQSKRLELEVNEIKRKVAYKPEVKKHAEHQFKFTELRVRELETTLAEERHAHQQTKENVKERSEQLNELDISPASTQKSLEEKDKDVASINQIIAAFNRRKQTKEKPSKEMEKEEVDTEHIDELNEIQRKLASEQKAKEEAQKLLQNYEVKTRELETTLAMTQELLKRKPGTEYEWILNREEIQLTEESLGRGAFGTVYKGVFRGTQVAVKQITVKPKITQYNRENFRREMKMASRCRHPCMLQFIGATSDDQSPLLVTELLDTSLKMVLLERALHPIEIITIAQDVAKGLNYLHLNRPHPIVHRDISSGNVLLWKHGHSWRGKISDYGNAVLMNYARTGSGGAIPYLAPEMDNQRFSTKSDVYSYGVLLLEMCLREEPSCFDDRDELICRVEDARMRNLVRRCLQEDPSQRPTMEEVLAELPTVS